LSAQLASKEIVALFLHFDNKILLFSGSYNLFLPSYTFPIEVILQELKDRKPLPPVPAPRTYKDLGVE
jgi:hypothetical protein